jgi:hypothetical protein
MIRSLVFSLFLAVVTLTAPGCSLFAGLATSNVVVDAQGFVEAANVADGIAVDIFDALPASVQASAGQAFATAQATFQGTITVIDDAIQAYEDGTSQNWVQLYADVQNAVTAISTLVAQLSNAQLAAGPPSNVLVLKVASLARAAATVHRYSPR